MGDFYGNIMAEHKIKSSVIECITLWAETHPCKNERFIPYPLPPIERKERENFVPERHYSPLEVLDQVLIETHVGIEYAERVAYVSETDRKALELLSRFS